MTTRIAILFRRVLSDSGQNLVVDADSLYWCNFDGGLILKAPKS